MTPAAIRPTGSSGTRRSSSCPIRTSSPPCGAPSPSPRPGRPTPRSPPRSACPSLPCAACSPRPCMSGAFEMGAWPTGHLWWTRRSGSGRRRQEPDGPPTPGAMPTRAARMPWRSSTAATAGQGSPGTRATTATATSARASWPPARPVRVRGAGAPPATRTPWSCTSRWWRGSWPRPPSGRRPWPPLSAPSSPQRQGRIRRPWPASPGSASRRWGATCATATRPSSTRRCAGSMPRRPAPGSPGRRMVCRPRSLSATSRRYLRPGPRPGAAPGASWWPTPSSSGSRCWGCSR